MTLKIIKYFLHFMLILTLSSFIIIDGNPFPDKKEYLEMREILHQELDALSKKYGLEKMTEEIDISSQGKLRTILCFSSKHRLNNDALRQRLVNTSKDLLEFLKKMNL